MTCGQIELQVPNLMKAKPWFVFSDLRASLYQGAGQEMICSIQHLIQQVSIKVKEKTY